MKNFYNILKRSHTEIPYSILESLFKCSILNESTASVELVYSDVLTGQYVYVTEHSHDSRTWRPWWKDYNDKNFINFVKPALRILKDLYMNGSSKLEFVQRERVAFVAYKEDKMWWAIIASLRPSKNKSMTSFAIITILNKDSKDIIGNINLAVDSNHEFVIDKYLPSELVVQKIEDLKMQKNMMDDERNNLTDDVEYTKMEIEEETDRQKVKDLKKSLASKELKLFSFERKYNKLENDITKYSMFESMTSVTKYQTNERMHVFSFNM